MPDLTLSHDGAIQVTVNRTCLCSAMVSDNLTMDSSGAISTPNQAATLSQDGAIEHQNMLSSISSFASILATKDKSLSCEGPIKVRDNNSNLSADAAISTRRAIPPYESISCDAAIQHSSRDQRLYNIVDAAIQVSDNDLSCSGDGTIQAPIGYMGGRGAFTATTIPASYIGLGLDESVIFREHAAHVPGASTPLFVGWHGWSSSESQPHGVNGIVGLEAELDARGWNYLSCRAQTQYHFGAPDALETVYKAIEWSQDGALGMGWNIDTSKIYFAGYSMGAGAALCYACRYHSSTFRPAAIICLAPTADMLEVFEAESNELMKLLTYWHYRGDAQTPSLYRQYWPLYLENGEIDFANSPARNMTAAVYLCYALNDTTVKVQEHCSKLASFFASQSIDYTTQTPAAPAVPHHWAILNVSNALDWIASKSL